jgi:hypothetical protein
MTYQERRIVTETVTISRDEYEGLKVAERKLAALERAGVDNWQGYEVIYAIEDDDEESW